MEWWGSYPSPELQSVYSTALADRDIQAGISDKFWYDMDHIDLI